METGLRALLTNNGVEESVIEWLGSNAQGCRTMKVFANWVDSKSELQATVLDHITDLRASRAQLGALKQAWREAEGIVSRSLKRAAEGLSDEALDEPLQPDVQKALEKVFAETYRWQLAAVHMPSDSLLGRGKREFERRQPSMFAVGRAKSLAASQRSTPIKRHRI